MYALNWLYITMSPRFGHFQKHIYIQLVAIVKIGVFAKTQQILYMIINQLQKMTVTSH